MTAIVTFTLVAHDLDREGPRTEALLFELEAAQTESGGLVIPGFTEVQLKETSVRLRSGLSLPAVPLHARITVAAPVKAGKPGMAGYSISPSAGMTAVLDLPLALALLDMGDDVAGLAVAGELGLDGSVRPVRGILAMTLAAQAAGLRGVVVPLENVGEALAVSGMEVHGVSRFDHVGDSVARRGYRTLNVAADRHRRELMNHIDFSDVRGNAAAVAALAACVRDRQDAILVGPPSTYKTMLARRVPSILPPMTLAQQVAVTKTYSAFGLARGLIAERPFRAPHYTISTAALLGTKGRPGEIHLAAYGVLLLDEVQEFSLARLAAMQLELDRMGDARPMIICTANSESGVIRTPVVNRAISMLGIKSAPIEVEIVPISEMRTASPCESSQAIRDRIWS